MALYGKALANQVPASTAGNQARLMFGAMTDALHSAYETLDSYATRATVADVAVGVLATPIASVALGSVDADAVAAARGYLDSENAMLAKYYPDMPESDSALTGQQLEELRASVSTCSVAVKTVDDLFNTSWLSDLSDAISSAAGTVTAAIANGVSKVAGSFIGGTWWVWLVVAATMVFVSRWKRGKL